MPFMLDDGEVKVVTAEQAGEDVLVRVDGHVVLALRGETLKVQTIETGVLEAGLTLEPA